MCSMLVDTGPIDFADHDFFFIDRALGNDLAVGAANETLSPKFDSVAASWRFVTDAIRRSDVATVRDRVTPLTGFPRRMLRRAKFLLLARMPANCRRVENDLRAAQCSQARSFWIPLVPANADTDSAALCF